MNRTVFISRNLKPDSVFLNELKDVGFEVYGESLIEFEAIEFQDFPKVDWIFFYSQNGVQFFEKGIFKKDKEYIFESIKLASIGESTAKVVSQIFGKCDFIGNGNPKTTSKAFLKLSKDQKILFPRAENSRQSIQKLLKNQIQDFDLIVYKNQPRKNIKLPDFETLVFTSPLNIKSYLENNKVLISQKIVAIGMTTFEVLKEYGFKNVFVSKSPNEKDLVEIVKSLFEPKT